ncbi:palmitoyl-acyl carrier protein thioesterase, chloroplastic-like isoform X2 [Fagus crenata]
MIIDIFGGKLLQGGLVFQQNFLIRSYELGPDGKVSLMALVNRLQESALNHFRSVGLLANGFGSTQQMIRKDLRLMNEVERLPSWADVVQGETWNSSSSGKKIIYDWLVRDYNSGETLIQGTSLYVMINKKTRRLSIVKEVYAEIEPHVMNCDPIISEDKKKLQQLDVDTADYVRTGLVPLWNDLDINQHVNHVKYISWILEVDPFVVPIRFFCLFFCVPLNAPHSILESHKLYVMTLEFRKECGRNSMLQSLTVINRAGLSSHDFGVEFDHSLPTYEDAS